MTPEQGALVSKTEERLSAARLLASHGQHGFAAARAYYAMFYLAEALLLSEGLAFSKHAGVIAAFGEHFAKTGRISPQFHRYLIRALEVRHLADYSTTPVGEAESVEQIARAQEFLVLARSFLEGGDPR